MFTPLLGRKSFVVSSRPLVQKSRFGTSNEDCSHEAIRSRLAHIKTSADIQNFIHHEQLQHPERLQSTIDVLKAEIARFVEGLADVRYQSLTDSLPESMDKKQQLQRLANNYWGVRVVWEKKQSSIASLNVTQAMPVLTNTQKLASTPTSKLTNLKPKEKKEYKLLQPAETFQRLLPEARQNKSVEENIHWIAQPKIIMMPEQFQLNGETVYQDLSWDSETHRVLITFFTADSDTMDEKDTTRFAFSVDAHNQIAPQVEVEASDVNFAESILQAFQISGVREALIR